MHIHTKQTTYTYTCHTHKPYRPHIHTYHTHTLICTLIPHIHTYIYIHIYSIHTYIHAHHIYTHIQHTNIYNKEGIRSMRPQYKTRLDQQKQNGLTLNITRTSQRLRKIHCWCGFQRPEPLVMTNTKQSINTGKGKWLRSTTR
jgi:hypothetical protein